MVREDLVGKIMLWVVVSFLVGFIFASCRYPLFLKESKGQWTLENPTAFEGNLLVIASLLIGVAVVQGQNLNRLLDIRHKRTCEGKQMSPGARRDYDYLRVGFWLLSGDVLVVMGMLALAISFGTSPSNSAAYFLGALWWSAITLIVGGWICLAIVAGRSYRD